MIYIFTEKISPRLEYVCKHIFNDILGVQFNVTTDIEFFKNINQTKINYSDKCFPETIKMVPHSLLFENTIFDHQPQLIQSEKHIAFFKTSDDPTLPCDLFACCFWMISRYEEYLPFKTDKHMRFSASASFALKNNLLDKPMTDIWALHIASILQTQYPSYKLSSRKTKHLATFDIDVAYAYKGRSFYRTIAASAKSIVSLNFVNIKNQLATLMKLQQDPYDIYDFIFTEYKRNNKKALIFITLAAYSTFDKNSSIKNKCIKKLILDLQKKAEIAIHPGYYSLEKPENIIKERIKLETILQTKIKKSRMHYLRFSLPNTYNKLIESEIEIDYSMGFADEPGFRAGTCTPFFFFDLTSNAESKLLIVPITIMDGSVHDYLKLNTAQALEKYKQLFDAVDSVSGTFVTIWHNTSLTEKGDWMGWQNIFSETLTWGENDPLS